MMDMKIPYTQNRCRFCSGSEDTNNMLIAPLCVITYLLTICLANGDLTNSKYAFKSGISRTNLKYTAVDVYNNKKYDNKRHLQTFIHLYRYLLQLTILFHLLTIWCVITYITSYKYPLENKLLQINSKLKTFFLFRLQVNLFQYIHCVMYMYPQHYPR